MNLDVLNAYNDVTNVELLKEYSQKPLRKCVRVNTLLKSVEEFKGYAASKSWELTPVEWCKEGFYIDREDIHNALGKDLWHQLGYFYIQEASSMLPVVVLDPQPGEYILDMSAAPGSKTTQMSSAMNNTGCIIANDVQPKRLKTLQAAQYRLGATNLFLTQKRGQWFADHLCEQFDRVLCDAPCSAQGTIRKDPQALDFFRQESVKAMAKVQLELLEAAIAATKVGGRIVYSTCTLTFEENEAIITEIIKKYQAAVSVLPPDSSMQTAWDPAEAIKNASLVQSQQNVPLVPVLRLWPHTYNSEGFFVAVLQKNAPTHTGKAVNEVPRRERVLSVKATEKYAATIFAQFGDTFLEPQELLCEFEGVLFAVHAQVATSSLPIKDYSMGIPYGKVLQNGTVRLSQEMAKLRGIRAKKRYITVNHEQYTQLEASLNSTCDSTISGDVVVQYNNAPLGVCKAMKGVLKNNLQRT